jgi:solute carrier family 25 phosphate transporter 3
MAPSSSSSSTHLTLDHYWRYAAAGGVCAMATHVMVVPVDVVKTRAQLHPRVLAYKSTLGGMKHVWGTEGASALLLGLAPTFWGYMGQGAAKYGNYEAFKAAFGRLMGAEWAQEHRLGVYVASAAASEALADLALAPLEAVRIRTVADPEIAKKGMVRALGHIAKTEGVVHGLYRGLPPLMMKQVPYTAAQLTVFEKALETVYSRLDGGKDAQTKPVQLMISLGCGALAGVLSGIVSHPADTILSAVNKEAKLDAAHHTTSTAQKRKVGMWRHSWELLMDTYKSGHVWAGLGPRLVMMTGMVAGQLLIYDSVKVALGLGASGTVVKPHQQ